MTWEAVFFDFDGVLVDSVPIKTSAFAEMFRPFGPEIESKVVQYHLSHGGVSREEKFRHIYAAFLQEKLDAGQLRELCRRFSQLVFQKVLKAPAIEGAEDLLQSLKKSRTPAFVISGTPQSEIREIVRQRNLEPHFAGVFGSPETKDRILGSVLREKGYAPAQCIFLGDSMEDYRAARVQGVLFWGIVPRENSSPFPPDTQTSCALWPLPTWHRGPGPLNRV